MDKPRRRQIAVAVTWFWPLSVAVASVAACAGAPRNHPAATGPAYVVPALAQELDRHGRFRMAIPQPLSTSSSRADSVAIAAAAFRRSMNARSGANATVPDSPLPVPCLRHFYVLPVLEGVPPTVPRSIALRYAPRWIVPMCDERGSPLLTVEVADGPSSLTIRDSGFAGGFFSSDGEYSLLENGPARDEGLALSPESAAAFAHERTRARLAAVPVAVMIHAGGLGNVLPAKCMRWRIKLERPVRMTGQYGEYETDEVYVRLSRYCLGEPILQVADRQQPSKGSIEHPRAGTKFADALFEKTEVRYARPVQFDSVRAIR